MALLSIIPARLDNQGNCIIVALADIGKYFISRSSSHAAPQNCGPRCMAHSYHTSAFEMVET